MLFPTKYWLGANYVRPSPPSRVCLEFGASIGPLHYQRNSYLEPSYHNCSGSRYLLEYILDLFLQIATANFIPIPGYCYFIAKGKLCSAHQVLKGALDIMKVVPAKLIHALCSAYCKNGPQDQEDSRFLFIWRICRFSKSPPFHLLLAMVVTTGLCVWNSRII